MRQTDEQAAFKKRLQVLVLPALPQARITRDAEGFPIVPGRLGRIEYLGTRPGYRERLHVYSDRARIVTKLLAIPGVERRQGGDTEARLAFPIDAPETLRAVARLIRIRVRREAATADGMRAARLRANVDMILA